MHGHETGGEDGAGGAGGSGEGGGLRGGSDGGGGRAGVPCTSRQFEYLCAIVMLASMNATHISAVASCAGT